MYERSTEVVNEEEEEENMENNWQKKGSCLLYDKWKKEKREKGKGKYRKIKQRSEKKTRDEKLQKKLFCLLYERSTEVVNVVKHVTKKFQVKTKEKR